MLNIPLVVFHDAEYLPSMAIASSVLLAQGKIPDYETFITTSISAKTEGKVIEPNAAAAAIYNKYYQRFCSIYPAFKQMVPIDG